MPALYIASLRSSGIAARDFGIDGQARSVGAKGLGGCLVVARRTGIGHEAQDGVEAQMRRALRIWLASDLHIDLRRPGRDRAVSLEPRQPLPVPEMFFRFDQKFASGDGVPHAVLDGAVGGLVFLPDPGGKVGEPVAGGEVGYVRHGPFQRRLTLRDRGFRAQPLRRACASTPIARASCTTSTLSASHCRRGRFAC
jgi:hypothetical protein